MLLGHYDVVKELLGVDADFRRSVFLALLRRDNRMLRLLIAAQADRDSSAREADQAPHA